MIIRKVRYSVTSLNLIFTLLVILKFDSNTVTVMYGPQGDSVISVGKWILMIFAILPPLYVLALDIMERFVYSKEKYSAETENSTLQKVLPIASVILILISWIIVLTLRARINKGYVELSGWLFIILGAVVMYASNYIVNLKPNSLALKFLPSRAKDEALWNKMLRLMSYSSAIGGYAILITGILGIILDNKLVIIAGFIFSVFCIIVPTVSYTLNLHKKLLLRKTKLDEKKIK